jgi:hypothetical protein
LITYKIKLDPKNKSIQKLVKMDIFGKIPTSLRGDDELWLELEEKFSNYDSSLPPEKFKDALYRTFNEIIARGEKVDKETIFFEDYNPKGMSGGHVHLPWWEKTGLPHLVSEYFKHFELQHSNQLILLQDILPLDDLKKEGQVILVRHYGPNLKEMVRMNLVEEYQSFQRMPAFRRAKYLVSFLAEPNNQAKLFGIFHIDEIQEKEKLPPYSIELSRYCDPQNRDTDFYMKLSKDQRFTKYERRLIINWVVPRGWYNTYGEVKNKPVVKITPRNFVDEFPGLMKINISYSDLKTIIENPESHSKWYESLTKLQAVYLIMDNISGNQYVGTTYGQDGLWQRWESYVKSGFTGGNKKLERLKQSDPNFFRGFQYSILEVLPRNANQADCTSAESLWKEKLGTRAFGLNMN